MVEATGELRERLADVIFRRNNMADKPWAPYQKGHERRVAALEAADRILVSDWLAAVVAEARTEGAIAELEAAANSKHPVTTVVTASTVAPPQYAVSERFDFNQSERARLLARAAALRGVGNQNAEPIAAWGAEKEVAKDRLAVIRAYIADPANWSALDGRREHLLALLDGRADQKGTEQ